MAELAHNNLKRMASNAVDLTSTARNLSERDRDYYDGYQWTTAETAILERRKQPVITINRIKRKIDAMVGIEQQGRVDPIAYPRNPQDQQAAEVASKALVYVDDNTRFDSKKSECFNNALIEGYAGVEIVVEPRRGQLEIAINRLRWEEIFYDPHSREKDFSDATYMGCMKWMSLDQALAMYKDSYEGDQDLTELLRSSFHTASDGQTYEDRPFESNSFIWADERRKRVRVAQMYYQNEGVWYFAVFCGGGEIFNIVSPYQDEDGQPACAIELFSCYVDRENRRYGVVRDMISAQDEINKRRSKILHQLNSRQTIGVKGGVDSVEAMKRELAQPDGHVAINVEQFEDALRAGVKPFEIVQNQDQTAGQFSLLQESKSEIDMLGPNASLLGQLSGQQSGRAIMAQQNAGMAELAPIYDSLRDWNLRVYRAIWNRIKQFWTEERYIRVTDDQRSVEFIGLNVQTGVVPVIDMATQQYVYAPQMENAVAEMDMDIVIQDAPDFVTLQAEQFEQLTTLAANGLPIPPEMIIEASSLPNKSDLLQKLKESQEANAQQAQAMQDQQMQMAIRKAMAEISKDEASAQKLMAEVAETQADTQKTVVETQQMAFGLR